MLPCQEPFRARSHALLPESRTGWLGYHAVAVAIAGRWTGRSPPAVTGSRVIIPGITGVHAPIGCGIRHIAGKLAVLGPKRIHGSSVFVFVGEDGLKFRSTDEILPQQHAADNQADDDEHYRKFDVFEGL